MHIVRKIQQNYIKKRYLGNLTSKGKEFLKDRSKEIDHLVVFAMVSWDD